MTEAKSGRSPRQKMKQRARRMIERLASASPEGRLAAAVIGQAVDDLFRPGRVDEVRYHDPDFFLGERGLAWEQMAGLASREAHRIVTRSGLLPETRKD